ncbi:fibronectin type III domain-containing protein [Aquimarina aquimarini]|uniref:fibronectin type III domain-containing protein n=1 Tax=Aquimarina aquimarini TaxID=1191734 RepID=UPI00131F0C72|nr:fibronectin type III domain-containing protein [Aquimarina aquimarini]
MNTLLKIVKLPIWALGILKIWCSYFLVAIRFPFAKSLMYLCFLLMSLSSIAQVFPVTATPQIVPPYSLKLSEYSTSISEKLILNLLLTDVNEFNFQVGLKLYIENNSGIAIQSSDVVVGANPIFLDGGTPLRLSNLDLQPYFSLQNLQGITPQQYSTTLPEGLYRFCFEVYDVITGKRISRKSCATVYLVLNDPPFLNMPNKGEQVVVRDPQNIIFQWTPRHLNATNVSYEFTLAELWDTQIDPQAAFLASRPLYQTTTFATTLLYGPAETSLLPDKNYAWRVRAIVNDGISESSVFKNNGYSEIYHFAYTGLCGEPQYILAEGQNPTKEKILWQGVEHKRYNVQYRKKGVENSRWFEEETQNQYATINALAPGTTYEFRVGGRCMDNGGFTYSQIYEFTTEISSQETATYNCGITPEIIITNQEPLQELLNGDVFTAGDFPVTIMELADPLNISQEGRYSGWGYIVVPYLMDTRLKVIFDNIKINTEYQLIQGTVYTDYDPDWSGVDDISDELDLLGGLLEELTNLFKEQQEFLDAYKDAKDPLVKDSILTNYNTSVLETDNRLNELLQSDYITEEEKQELRDVKDIDKIASSDLSDKEVDNYKKLNAQKADKVKEIAQKAEERERKAEEVIYDDEEYFKKLLQQIRCAYISGQDAIDIPEKYLNIDKLVIGSFKYGVDREEQISGKKVSIATVRPAFGTTVISGIKDAKSRNTNSDGKISFTGFDILITNPKYNEAGGITPLKHFMEYLFPTEESVRNDFDFVWNSGIGAKVNKNVTLEKKEIYQLKRIASCGTKYLKAEERYKLIKAVLLYDSDEYYEDLVLDIIATIDTKRKAKDLYNRINTDIGLQKLLVENINDITTYLFFDDGNENNLSRFTKEYFKLFKKVYSNSELEGLYKAKSFPDKNKFFFYGFDHDCDFTLSVDQKEEKLIIKEQPRVFDPHLGKTGHCVDRGSAKETSFVAQDILAVSIADKEVSLFGEKDKTVMMPTLAYYLLIKAANAEEVENIINGLVTLVGIITPFDEFYFLSQALKLSQKGLRAANLVTFKALAKIDNIKVPLNSLGRRLEKEAFTDINKYVSFVDDINNAGGVWRTALEMRDDVSNWAKLYQSKLPTPTQLDKFNKATVASYKKVDNSIETVFGRNGGILNTQSSFPTISAEKGLGIHPTLQNKLPSNTKWPNVANCAECDAVNQALHNGAKWDDIQIHTVDIRPNGKITDVIRCHECQDIFKKMYVTSE